MIVPNPFCHVLVVDPSPEIHARIARYVEGKGVAVTTAPDPSSAVAAMDRGGPDIVITDLFLPGNAGLALTREIRSRHELCPVIVMAKDAPEPVVTQALRAGAVGYLQKPVSEEGLERALARARQHVSGELMDLPEASRLECRLTMGLDLDGVPRVIAWLMNVSVRSFPESRQLQVRGALQELVFNAIEHGSLDVCSDDKRKALYEGRYDAMLEERRNDPRYRDRKVVIAVIRDRDKACLTYRVTDEGKGFDWRRSLCQSQDTGGEDASGRGIFLVQAFFPTLSYNELGNEVTFTVPLG